MYTPIELDKIRNLRYGMKAISLIEKKLNVKSISKLDFNDLSMEEIATVIWAGLEHEDKDLNPDKVMILIDEYSDFETIAEMMGKAMSDFFQKKKSNK
jgi:hypothetical protein